MPDRRRVGREHASRPAHAAHPGSSPGGWCSRWASCSAPVWSGPSGPRTRSSSPSRSSSPCCFTAYGAWAVFVREPAQPATASSWSRRWWISALVTTIVHFAGQPQSAFPALYVLVVAAYALLMPPAGGPSPRCSPRRLFLGDAFWSRAGAPDTAFWAQFVVFNVVFPIVAVLGHRLREAGMEQETLAIELKRVRLEADDILRNIRSGVLTVDGLGRLAFINPTGQRLLDLDGEGLIGLPVLDQLKTRSSELWAAVVAGIRSGRKISRGEGMVPHQGGQHLPDRPQHHRLPPGGAGGAVGDRHLHRHLRPEGGAGAAGPRRAAGGGGGAERVAGARDPEPAGLHPELGGAARPLALRRRRRALPRRASSSGRATG